ncbi:hypothetical protein L1987_10603 [Smallanthus sonchifolius]|uniref:Uncharacterized protein n=1 Tax=Smallanthus sonchifolius TaxID=185202 RepID=A0ACB9JSP6_9ASTR|nr:hypothetical protein L1987_10603 [Smallanthus sonchifolius]
MLFEVWVMDHGSFTRLYDIPAPNVSTRGLQGSREPTGVVFEANGGCRTSVPTLSALQLVKGVKKGEETFVDALVRDEENGSSEELPTVL